MNALVRINLFIIIIIAFSEKEKGLKMTLCILRIGINDNEKSGAAVSGNYFFYSYF